MEFNIKENVLNITKVAEISLRHIYDEIENTEFLNQAKVLKAFNDNKVSSMHLGYTTGYGYDDSGREVIEKVYADIFKAEDALVRIQFVNGTHAISTALFANLKKDDTLVYITGKPYDTLHESIGIKEHHQSLIANGVKFDTIELLNDESFDTDSIVKYVKDNNPKIVAIQRSKGYAFRKTMTIQDIQNIIQKIREVNNECYIFVDNCYGEFVEEKEPTEVGADICIGSLIKNIGGSLCETGAYIVGKKDLVENCATRLTCPGIGKECGATLDQNKNILHGLFIAPSVVKDALKAMVFASYMFEKLDFECMPKYSDKRSDIVQTVRFQDKEKLIKFIQGIQKTSPVDSHVTPYPWAMPGYDDEVIMAAGTFIQGASIELSADSPIREPYVAYMQGGITYSSAKLAIMVAISDML